MNSSILSREYQASFVDDPKYAGRVATHLAGLASAIEDSHLSWRPTVSRLVSLLPKSEQSNSVVAAGMAYGAGKNILNYYPGPAILLFGAALNVIGNSPNIELQESINRSKIILAESHLDQNEDITQLLLAAEQRASFDKVSQMLRGEFSQGLRDSGKYNNEKIKDVTRKIVNITHDVRHRGLIERIEWKKIKVEEDGSSTNTGYFHEIDEIIFGDDLLQELGRYAQDKKGVPLVFLEECWNGTVSLNENLRLRL